MVCRMKEYWCTFGIDHCMFTYSGIFFACGGNWTQNGNVHVNMPEEEGGKGECMLEGDTHVFCKS